MKRLFYSSFFFIGLVAALLFAIPKSLIAQSACPNDNVFANSITSIPCEPGTTLSIGAGTYVNFTVVAGGEYTFSFCGSNTFDTQITGYQGSGSNPLFVVDDNGALCGGTDASIGPWVSNFDGTLRLVIDESGCTACPTTGPGTYCPELGSAVLTYMQNNNLQITSSSSRMCAGEVRTLTATPSGGTFSGIGVSGNTTFTAPDANQTYTITYTFNQCSVTQQIQVVTNPTAVIDGDEIFCTGQNVILSAANSLPGGPGGTTISTYAWYRNGSYIGNTSQYTATQGGDYTVVVTNSLNCSATSDVKQIFASGQGPTVSIMGTSPVGYCPGGSPSSLLTANATAGSGSISGYQWYFNGGSLGAAGTGTTYNATQAGNYTVEVANSDGCSTLSAVFTLTFNEYAAPTIIISANPGTQICPDGSTMLSAVVIPGSGTVPLSSYEWRRDGISVGTGVMQISADEGGGYTLEVTSSNGCTSTSPPFTITELPEPAVYITGPIGFCPGETINLVANPSGGNSYNYQWKRGGNPVGVNNQTLSNVSTGGDYTVEITTGQGCTAASVVYHVEEYLVPAVNISGDDEICPGGDPVTLTAQLSGQGTGLVTSYQWKESGIDIFNASQSAYDATEGGQYQVEITTNNGCSVTSPVHEIDELNSPDPYITGDNTICTGNTVTLTANVTPGTGSGFYSYQWRLNGGNLVPGSGSTYSASLPGTYTVVVTDLTALDCPGESPGFTIVSAGPTVNIFGDNGFCPGGHADLMASATPATGTSIVSYQWLRDGNTFGGPNSPNYTATVAGNYTVVVTDNLGCQTESPVYTVTAGVTPVVSISGPNDLCAGGGSIVLTANITAGSPISTYVWRLNGNTVGGNDPSYTAVAAGNYTLEVTNNVGCTATSTTFGVTATQGPTVNITGGTALCSGDSVTLTANTTGTITTYEWKLNAVAVGTNSSTLIAIQAGDYTVAVSDNGGCTTESAIHTITAQATPTINISGSNTICSGDSTVLMAVTGGGSGTISSYLWTLNGSSVGTNSTYTATQAGDYRVEVTDANSCSAESAAHTVTVSQSPTVSITGNNLFCVGDSSVLTANATAGSGTIDTYQWKRNSSPVGGNSSTFTAHLSGNYTVEVTNSGGCATTSASFTIFVVLAPTVSISVNPGSCSGDSTVLTAHATAGSGTIASYQWKLNGTNVGPNDSTFSTVQAGSYSVVVTNSDGCSTTDSAQVVNPGGPTVFISSGDSSICPGDNVLLIANAGGIPPLMYQWKLDGVDVGTNSLTYNASQGGNYSVVVTDSTGCSTVSTAFPITEFNPPTVVLAGDTGFCKNDSVLLTANATPGSGPIASYQWRLSGANVGTNSSTYYATQTGNYSVEVTDSNGCSSQAASSITEYQLPTVSISGSGVACSSDTVTWTTTASAGSGTITSYQWQLNGSNINANGDTLVTDQPGDYTVIVVNSFGCSSQTTKRLLEIPTPTVNPIVGGSSLCNVDSVQLTVTASAGSGGTIASYQWRLNGTDVGGNSNTYFATQAGDYTVEVTNTNGCSAETGVKTISGQTPTCNITGDNTICPGDSTIFTASGGDIYSWTGPSGFTANTASTGYISTPGRYDVIVIVDSCFSSCFRSLIVLPPDSCAIDSSCVTQNITIEPGWNLVSSYIDPDTPDLISIFSDITSDIIIVKNVAGASYLPTFGINTIGDWIVEEGYKVKASTSTTLTISCVQVDPTTTPISLQTGWSIISYLRTTPMDAVTALSSLNPSCVVIVKNIDGDSYIPSFGINTIGDLLPGQGYSIKMSCPDTLIYPANGPKTSSSGFYTQVMRPSHYKVSTNTGHNATIVVPTNSLSDIMVGDEIGIFNNEDVLVGSAVYEGNNLAITVWGDDPTTDHFENMLTGDEFNVKIWRSAQQKEIEATAAYEDDNGYYQNDGVSIMKRLTPNQDVADVSCYPNPTSGMINFHFEMPDEAEATLGIYDIVGKTLTDPLLKVDGTSNRDIKYDASKLPTGLYFYRASVNGQLFNGSFVVDR